MIYFDNAATGGFKNYFVTETAINILKYLSANPGRSGHRLSNKGAELIYEARTVLQKAFGATEPNNVIFTDGCTTALNTAILGTVQPQKNVVTTVFEHNSVLRPLHYLKERGEISLTIVEPIDKEPFEKTIFDAVKDDTYLVAVTGASNVTGQVIDIEKLGLMLKNTNALFLVDGAQLLGHANVDVQKSNVDMLCVAGHKALGGIFGSGALILSDRVNVSPLTRGGTGTETFNLSQPNCLPEKLESGTLNLPAIVALSEAVNFTTKNAERFGALLYKRTEYIIKRLLELNNVTLYSKPNVCGIIGFNVNGLDSGETAELLDTRYDIAVRGGYHCAPLAHIHLKTDTGGLVRASLAPQNTSQEISDFLEAISELSKI